MHRYLRCVILSVQYSCIEVSVINTFDTELLLEVAPDDYTYIEADNSKDYKPGVYRLTSVAVNEKRVGYINYEKPFAFNSDAKYEPITKLSYGNKITQMFIDEFINQEVTKSEESEK